MNRTKESTGCGKQKEINSCGIIETSENAKTSCLSISKCCLDKMQFLISDTL